MTKKMKICLWIASVILLIIVIYGGVTLYQRNVVYRPTMTESEIVEYRRSHPLCCSSDPLADMSTGPIWIYMNRADYVMVRYEKGTFWYEDMFLEIDDTNIMDYVKEDGQIPIKYGSAFKWWGDNLISGQRYLIMVSAVEGESSLIGCPWYIFYVTDDDCVVSATYGTNVDRRVAKSFDGFSLTDFRKGLKQARRFERIAAMEVDYSKQVMEGLDQWKEAERGFFTIEISGSDGNQPSRTVEYNAEELQEYWKMASRKHGIKRYYGNAYLYENESEMESISIFYTLNETGTLTEVDIRQSRFMKEDYWYSNITIYYDNVMTEEEVAEYRQKHPQYDISSPVSELNIREMSFYLGECYYVQMEYLGQPAQCGNSHFDLYEFGFQEIWWNWGKQIWPENTYLPGDTIELAIAKYWDMPNLKKGQQYLFLVGVLDDVIEPVVYPQYSFYVTEEGQLVSLTQESQSDEFTGHSLVWFSHQLQQGLGDRRKGELVWRSDEERETMIKDHPAYTIEEVQGLRNLYPVQDERYPNSTETEVPSSWGMNFEAAFAEYDAILTGKVNEIVLAASKDAKIHLGEWQGTVSEMMSGNEPMIIYQRDDKAYLVFQVEEILWTNQNKVSQLVADQTILFVMDSDSWWEMETLLTKGKSYLLGVNHTTLTDTYVMDRQSGFYRTPEGYLFSFVSGTNSNRFSGMHQAVYEQALQDAANTVRSNPWMLGLKTGITTE